MNDDDLKRMLRDADPSAGQPPLDDARIRRLVAAAERDGLAGQTAPASRHRRRLFAGVSIGAAATAAAAALIAGLVATPAIQAPGPDETRAACGTPSVESLGEFDTAYEATATAVAGDEVTLEVKEVFAGSPGTSLTVEQVEDGSTEVFTTGQTYLIASADGFISPCESGLATDALRQLYVRAYGAPTNG